MSEMEPETTTEGASTGSDAAEDTLAGPGLTPQEEEILLNRLRDLGYVE